MILDVISQQKVKKQAKLFDDLAFTWYGDYIYISAIDADEQSFHSCV